MKETEKECNNIENNEVNNSNECCDNLSDKECGSNECDNLSEKEVEIADESAILTAAAKEWQDKYMRLSAEFDNYRKRTLKEKMDLLGTASEGVIKTILPIVDDFDRASEAMSKSDDIDALRSGVELIHKRLLDILKQQGVTQIEAMNAELDTDFHDAIAKFPVEDKEKKGKIIDVVEKGYMMKEKVVRYAKVVVGE
ncbi:MAG: nucleotide exchange factor GrpE [Rikenellaceae bacterium]